MSTQGEIKKDVDISRYSTNESSSEVKFKINNFEKSKFVDFEIIELTDAEGTCTLLNGMISEDLSVGETYYKNIQDSDLLIKFKLKYTKNWSKNDGASVQSFANINTENNITIASKVTGVKGKVRLVYKIDGQTYYSKNIYDIPSYDDFMIYCKVDGNKWHQNDWEVGVVDVAKGNICDTKPVEFYTLNRESSLIGFAGAVNNVNQAKTAGRKFYLIENIDISQTIKPISVLNDSSWFDGLFSGGCYMDSIGWLQESNDRHSITYINDVKIDTTAGNDYAYGLFGWVGSPAQIKNLIINNIKVDSSGDYHTRRTSRICRQWRLNRKCHNTKW